MSRWSYAVVAALLLAPACTSPDEEEELYLPTADEARARADATITEANADAEFAELKEQIETEER